MQYYFPAFKWKKGDIFFFNNVKMAHARMNVKCLRTRYAVLVRGLLRYKSLVSLVKI